jgi:hypothetical protein
MALQDDERDRRVGLWSTLRGLDSDDVPAAILRDLGIYGGAQGIWVDKQEQSRFILTALVSLSACCIPEGTTPTTFRKTS